MLASNVPEEGGDSLFLVVGAFKVVREAAAGETRCDLRPVTRRSADDSEPWTCKSVAM